MIEELGRSRRLGVDTESNSLHAFNERVCFIQISNPRANYIIDPIRLENISELGTLFSDPKTEKIFHGADYDIGLLKRDFGFNFSNLFDTMTAAQYLNLEKLGMADLVEQCFGIHLEKKFTKCNWAQRPVSLDRMVYLCLDTQYLIGLRDWLFKQLKEKDLVEEAALEFEFLVTRSPLEPAYENQTMWDIKGAKGLEKKLLPYLYELFKWRRRQSKKQDRPPFKVINNKTLLEIAQKQPKNKDELMAIKGITPTVWRRYGRFLLNAVNRASQVPDSWRPPHDDKKKNNRRTAIHYDDQNLADKLKKWRQEKAAERDIHPLAVMPGHVLIDICRKKPATKESLAKIQWLGEKRAKLYGDEIIDIIIEKNS